MLRTWAPKVCVLVDVIVSVSDALTEKKRLMLARHLQYVLTRDMCIKTILYAFNQKMLPGMQCFLRQSSSRLLILLSLLLSSFDLLLGKERSCAVVKVKVLNRTD